MMPTEEEKRQKETQIDQLMDAFSNIHPKYIEEARQAVSSEDSESSGFSVSRKIGRLFNAINFFNADKFFQQLRQLLHSPVVRTAVISCLILLVATAGFRNGMLFDSIGLGGSSGSSENTSLPSNINTESDQMLSGNSSSQLSASETMAETETQSVEKSLSEAYATTPPELTLNNFSDAASNNTEKEFSIRGISNDYSWTYPNEDGTNTSVIACAASDIWSCSDLPVLALQAGDSITLQFTENEPDSLTIHYLPISAAAESSQEDTDSKNSGKNGSDPETSSPENPENLEKQIQEIKLSEDDRFQLPEEKGTYIVEIQAFWDNAIYKGNCTYGLQVQYEEP